MHPGLFLILKTWVWLGRIGSYLVGLHKKRVKQRTPTTPPAGLRRNARKGRRLNRELRTLLSKVPNPNCVKFGFAGLRKKILKRPAPASKLRTPNLKPRTPGPRTPNPNIAILFFGWGSHFSCFPPGAPSVVYAFPKLGFTF